MSDDHQNDNPALVLDKPYNSSDPDQVNNARKKAGRKKIASLKVIEALMQHKDGRAWLWDLIGSYDPYGYPVVPGDPYLTYYNIGQQNKGKELLMQALQFPELYLLMMNEASGKK